ncbi:MAG: bifunctional phosphoribosylaminoimidazolecarboxamide formyltransferase/IMP cyclohydrolase PurH [Myxococcales bacterium]|nr:bifunctional phosphoribosylaminoimidazolecarboxamide formyltransferase/IMP cyclohydrolase PurH [Myxococcales bacterium]
MTKTAPKNILISVFHKNGLAELLKALSTLNVSIFSTGGTATAIQALGYSVNLIEDLTGFPAMLNGRVKTLHPKVFGGLLARRNHPTDLDELDEYDIPTFDWVIVDLYPFENCLKLKSDHHEQIEQIDIGGVSLIRAAAKNYQDILVISQIEQYPELITLINQHQGETDLSTRKWFAHQAFTLTAKYDQLIAHYLYSEVEQISLKLKYGENPHQTAEFIGDFYQQFECYGDKQPSYNNLVDLEAGLQVIDEFEEPSFAILKHTNTCGLASHLQLEKAFDRALAGDPISAFGGILVCNQKINLATAEKIDQLFYEVLVAPDYSAQALARLQARKRRLILKRIHRTDADLAKSKKTVLNGMLVQALDRAIELPEQWQIMTDVPLQIQESTDALFALRAVKHLKSNAIALVKNKQLIGMGCGQTSRIIALEQAIDKAKQGKFDLQGAVMASDAFFPFPDCIERAAEQGIRTVIQPGGSKRDQESIDAAKRLQVTLIMTGVRHFKH